MLSLKYSNKPNDENIKLEVFYTHFPYGDERHLTRRLIAEGIREIRRIDSSCSDKMEFPSLKDAFSAIDYIRAYAKQRGCLVLNVKIEFKNDKDVIPSD